MRYGILDVSAGKSHDHCADRNRHFTPSSPFISEIQESAQTAHMDGYSSGFKVGRRVGYEAGYKDGYSEGYSKEKSFSTSSADYSTNPFISMEDIRKRRELLEKENESSSESDSHWTAEKVHQMLESPPS
jgi:flagellar biosynthesis/type III secretory pathway protein FliH